MQRREFITILGGAVAAWPLPARAQTLRVRRIGMLVSFGETDKDGQTWVSGFRQVLRELGWEDGRNLRIDYRWAAGDTERMRARPDVILVAGTPVVAHVHRATQSVPVVFVQVTDPVDAGFVESLAHPAGT
jgi:putative ABC transport system substrate-binding protein